MQSRWIRWLCMPICTRLVSVSYWNDDLLMVKFLWFFIEGYVSEILLDYWVFWTFFSEKKFFWSCFRMIQWMCLGFCHFLLLSHCSHVLAYLFRLCVALWSFLIHFSWSVQIEIINMIKKTLKNPLLYIAS